MGYLVRTVDGVFTAMSYADPKLAILAVIRYFYPKANEVRHLSDDPPSPNLNDPCVQHWEALDSTKKSLGEIGVIVNQDADIMDPD